MTIISNHQKILRIYLYNNRQLYNSKDNKENRETHYKTDIHQRIPFMSDPRLVVERKFKTLSMCLGWLRKQRIGACAAKTEFLWKRPRQDRHRQKGQEQTATNKDLPYN